jgi:hypothetical protein
MLLERGRGFGIISGCGGTWERGMVRNGERCRNCGG